MDPGKGTAMRMGLVAGIGLLLSLQSVGCSKSIYPHALPPDRTVVPSSMHPVAIDVGLVGTYPAWTKSGAGYFYDDVLEYRVWMKPPGGGNSFYRAFASYEPALDFSKKTPNSEEPLVLVRQLQGLGGVLFDEQAASDTTTSISYAALANAGPSLTIPFAAPVDPMS